MPTLPLLPPKYGPSEIFYCKNTREKNNQRKWIKGAKTKSGKGKKTQKCLVGEALRLNPKAIVAYADIPLNSLPCENRSWDRCD